MSIAIVTDGNNQLGMGHVFQALTLAKLISFRSQELLKFFTKSESHVQKLIEANGFAVEFCENDEIIFEKLKLLNPKKIIFDKIDVSPALAKKIKNEIISKLIIFTNLTEASVYADINVLADVNFPNVVRTHNDRKEYLGPKYWLLRPEFYQFKSLKKPRAEHFKKILIMFGGADPLNFTKKTLMALSEYPDLLDIMIVTGASYKSSNELEKTVKEINLRKKHMVKLVSNIKNVAEEMFNCDVLFTSPGLSFFESLMVGTPVVCFHQNEQQRQEFSKIFPTLGENDVIKVCNILNSKDFIFPDSAPVKMMQIGEGVDEILDEIVGC